MLLLCHHHEHHEDIEQLTSERLRDQAEDTVGVTGCRGLALIVQPTAQQIHLHGYRHTRPAAATDLTAYAAASPRVIPSKYWPM